jgi:DNA (cytosine-5)-methyltransferase 1
MNYYNEIDPFASTWLENLKDAGMIPDGEIDTRAIQDVKAHDLHGFTQCHFFAGIGGWPLALKIAGWPTTTPIWTGSPPCQDASCLASIHGKQSGVDGKRTGMALVWLELIEQCRPPFVVFENVPGFEKNPGPFFDRLGQAGYSISREKRTARSVGAPHIRRRLFAIAKRDGARWPLCRSDRSPETILRPWAAPPGNVWRKDRAGNCTMDDGLPGRMAKIRAFGNAIVPQQAADFIRKNANNAQMDGQKAARRLTPRYLSKEAICTKKQRKK